MEHLRPSFQKKYSCYTLNFDLLKKYIEHYDKILFKSPNLFSSSAIFISQKNFEDISATIKAIEEITSNSIYQDKILKNAPAIAQFNPGVKGVFMGYDFHLTESGPKLIEINTNAGGGPINLYLAKAHSLISNDQTFKTPINLNQIEELIFNNFIQECSLERPEKYPKFVAIIDDHPEDQFLRGEFELFKKIFEKNGLEAMIIDPQDLIFRENKLWYQGRIVDLIYNRLTDFYFEETSHDCLKQAYLDGNTTITPSPYNHALYANKRNLIMLSNEEEINKVNISSESKKIILQNVPKTYPLTRSNESDMWKNRKEFFFKPNSGFGSKAAYRGDKITHKTWAQIVDNNYVAQKIVPPCECLIDVDNKKIALKFDVRAYVFSGEIQLLAARLYSGQTTNFRTPGGGFAPVFINSN